MYQLGSYVKFFNILRDLEDESLIDNKQKQLLKINFTTKDQQLMDILSQLENEDEEEIKFSLLNYLKTQNQMKPTIQRHAKRTRSSITDIKLKQSLQMEEKKVQDQKAQQELEKASTLIMNAILKERDGLLVDQKSNEIIENLKTFIVNQVSPLKPVFQYGRSNSYISDINGSLEEALLEGYKGIKSQFANHMRSHLLLMDENVSYNNIFILLKEMSRHLVSCDQFSFLFTQNDQVELYSTLNDSIEMMVLDNAVKEEMEQIPENRIYKLTYDSEICKLLQVESESNCFKWNNTVIIYHSIKRKPGEFEANLLKIANEYQLFDEIKYLSQFLIQTVQNAKVQFFSPLSIADMILDIGISFVRSSKYLLIEEMYQQMSKFYKVEKQKYKIFINFRLFADSTEYQPYDPDAHHILFKDLQMTIIFKITSMNLTKQADQRIYTEVKQYYEKYLRFIRECYDKSAFYKFFLRSNDSLIFEFDKSGHLVFLSRPIPPLIKENFNIKFNGQLIHNNQLSYTQIFDPIIISDIENYLEDQKWKVKKENENQQYEIFLKIEEKTYKGFAVIFTENQKGWIKEQLKTLNCGQMNSKIQAKIRKQLIQHETMTFVNKLEENNPEFKNSVASLYIPINQNFLRKKVQSIQEVRVQQDKPRNRLTEIPKSQYEQELKLEEFALDSNDDIVDTFDYNILEFTKQLQKHRTVWAILKKIGALEDYQIPYEICENFIKEIEYHYNANQNPYHNYDHGVTVMQTVHYVTLLTYKTKYAKLIDSFQRFTLIVSSLCHDVGHTGKTNLYEINSLSDLAIRYHDKSVLEQHHAALTIQILKNPNCNIIQNLSQEQFRDFRKGLISNILYTDMSEHFGLLKDFENRGCDFNDSKILCGVILHLSDFGGVVKRSSIAHQWSNRVNQEFIAQNRLEEQYGYPQLPYMKDLDKPHIMAKSEIGFLKCIVRPAWAMMSDFLEGQLQHCIQNIDESIQQWEKIAKKGEQ